jgi:hypothetical protein
MSHFVVLVVGDENIPDLLHPYQEQYSGDPSIDPRFEFVDKTDEVKKDFEAYDFVSKGYLLIGPESQEGVVRSNSIVSFLESQHGLPTLESFAYWWEGYEPDSEGRFGHYHNPNAKWDWWAVGGRWQGFFTHKDGSKVNTIRKGDWDMQADMDKAAEAASKRWDIANAIISRHAEFEPWSAFVKMVEAKEVTWEEARTSYHAQPLVQEWQSADNDIMWEDPSDYMMGKDTYVAQSAISAISTFAYIKDGQWVGGAKMGWFALDYDANMTVGEWRSHYLKMVQDLDDDTTLTVVDCHI